MLMRLPSASSTICPVCGGSDGVCAARPASQCAEREQRGYSVVDGYGAEGLVVLALCADAVRPGYLAIHLIGLSAGTLLLPPSPSYFRRVQAQLRLSSSATLRTDTSDPGYDSSDDDTPSRRRSTRVQQRRENDKTATELCSYAAVWWTMFGLVSYLHTGGDVSRRVVSHLFLL